jgi:hypothetical protein
VDEHVAVVVSIARNKVRRIGIKGHETPVGAEHRVSAGPVALSAVAGNANAFGGTVHPIMDKDVAGGDVRRIESAP